MVEVCGEVTSPKPPSTGQSHPLSADQASEPDSDQLNKEQQDQDSAPAVGLTDLVTGPEAAPPPGQTECETAEATVETSKLTDTVSSVPRPGEEAPSLEDSRTEKVQDEVGSERSSKSADLTYSREFQAIKLASIQMVAIKTLAAVISCGRFRELLLVPRATLHSDGSQEKSLLEDLAAERDEDLKLAMRNIVRHLVHRATMPSPFRRVVSMVELERSFSVLHADIIRTMTEEHLGLPVLEGRKAMLCCSERVDSCV